jgi:hypothetical protein
MKISRKFIILPILAIIIIALTYFIFKSYQHSGGANPLDEAMKYKQDYSILYISGTTNDNIQIEEYFIVNSDEKVVEERKILIGYTDESLNSQYNALKNFDNKSIYNVKINGKSLIYSSTVFNGKTIDQVIETFTSGNYKNLIIKEI